MSELVSIIVPVYNVENYLPRCLDSLVAQTYRNLQIILVDDGSGDRSGIICDEYAKRDSRITVIHQENQGVSVARNNGIELAAGVYIGFCDADDYVEPYMYEYLCSLIKGSLCNIASCGAYIETESSRHPVGYSSSTKKELNVEDAIAELHLRREISEWVYTKLYDKTIVKQCRFNKDLKIAEDYLFVCEAIEKSTGVISGHKVGYHYIQRKTSAVNSGYSNDYEKAVEVTKKSTHLLGNKYPSKKKQIYSKYIMDSMGLITSMIKGNNINKKRVEELQKEIRKNLIMYITTDGPELYFKVSAIVISVCFPLFKFVYRKLKRFE